MFRRGPACVLTAAVSCSRLSSSALASRHISSSLALAPFVSVSGSDSLRRRQQRHRCVDSDELSVLSQQSRRQFCSMTRCLLSASASQPPPPILFESIADPLVAEIARVTHAKGNVPLGNVLGMVSAKVRDAIFRSGKGVEGFLKAGSPALLVVEEKGMKFLKSNIIPDVAAENASSDEIILLKNYLGSRSKVFSHISDVTIFKTMFASEVAALEKISTQVCGSSFVPIQTLHSKLRLSRCTIEDFVQVLEATGAYWVVKSHLCRLKGEGELLPPVEASAQPPSTPLSSTSAQIADLGASPPPTNNRASIPFKHIHPSPSNNWGGWGGQANVPTAEDVYEILKYIPVHWGNLGALNIPTAVRKKHVRISSFLQWLRRQPKFFEVRNIAGTLEVRRAVPLHPEQHGKTQAEADAWLIERVASGEHNAIVTGINDGLSTSTSQAATAILKFLMRVTPGYFVAPELIFMRYTKKGLTVYELQQAVKEHTSIFETITLFDDQCIVRRKTGADSSKWRDVFMADMLSIPEDVKGLFVLMGRSSVCWDRPEYLYVRLLDHEKILVGGYDAMLALMKRHPQVFKMGQSFFRRVDHSDPGGDDDEPTTHEERVFKKVEENVYHGHRDVATVFHYLSPDDGFVNVTQLSEAASPAIHATLPPRIVTVLQLFPDLFTCKETSPGMFSVKKVLAKKSGSPSSSAAATSSSSPSRGFGGAAATTSSSVNDMMGMEEMGMGDDDDGEMTRKETVEAIKNLIPARGVEVNQLSQWLSMDVRKSVTKHFETLQGLIDFNRDQFSTDTANVVTVKNP